MNEPLPLLATQHGKGRLSEQDLKEVWHGVDVHVGNKDIPSIPVYEEIEYLYSLMVSLRYL